MSERRELSTAEACQSTHLLIDVVHQFYSESETVEAPFLTAYFVFACQSYYWLNYLAQTAEESVQVIEKLKADLMGNWVTFLKLDGQIYPATVSNPSSSAGN